MKVYFYPIPNYGDLLNIPIFKHYCGAEVLPYQQMEDGKGFMGIGTLAGYVIPDEWFDNREITFLGTGGVGTKLKGKHKGFARGEISAAKLGVPCVGDVGLLIDRVFNGEIARVDRTAVVLDKTPVAPLATRIFTALSENDLPLPCAFSAFNTSVPEVYGFIAKARYVITDRLHVATTAEALKIPWLIFNHGNGDLAKTPDKFLDWADTIDKGRFVVNPLEVGLIKENTDFEKSEIQKDRLEKELRKR